MNYNNYYEIEASLRQHVRQAQKGIKCSALQGAFIFGVASSIMLTLGAILGKDTREYIRLTILMFLSGGVLSVLGFIAPWCYVKLSMARLRRYIIKIRALGDE